MSDRGKQARGARARLARLAALGAALGLAGCAIATPFKPAAHAPPGAGDRPAIIAVTEARLGDNRALRRAFWDHVDKVEASLPDQPGFLGFSKRTELFGDRAWTMTAWTDEDSLEAFVRSETHQRAIAAAFGALDGARFARIETTRGAMPPDWDAALRQLDQAGRAY